MSLKVFMENGHPLHDHVRRKLAMERNFRAAIPIFDNFVPKQMQFVCPYFVSPISFVAFCMCKHSDKILHYCGWVCWRAIKQQELIAATCFPAQADTYAYSQKHTLAKIGCLCLVSRNLMVSYRSHHPGQSPFLF